MTRQDFINNICLSFTTKEEGFSVKKCISVVVVLVMLVITFYEFDDNNWLAILGLWLGFVTSLLITGAVEKNISAVNETKQKENEKSP